MSAVDVAFMIGAIAGAMLATLVSAAVAVLLHCKAAERIERIAGAQGYRAGRRAEREETATEDFR